MGVCFDTNDSIKENYRLTNKTGKLPRHELNRHKILNTTIIDIC